jgi:hypothetical protein
LDSTDPAAIGGQWIGDVFVPPPQRCEHVAVYLALHRGGVDAADLSRLGIPVGVSQAVLTRLVAEGKLTDEGDGCYGPPPAR